MNQFLKFCINGGIATVIQYVTYWLATYIMNVSVAYVVGYAVSFAYNYVLTTRWTFRSRMTWKNFVGFTGSHAVNFTIHMVCFNLFIFMGIHKFIAPILVLLIAVPTNYLILKFVYKK